MGVIQGSINNLLATAGIAARLSHGLEERRELIGVKKAYEKTSKLLEESENKTYAEDIAKTQRERAQRIAELDPTEENIRNYIAEAEGYESIQPETESAEKSYQQEKNMTYEQRIDKRLAAMNKAQQDMLIKQQELRGGIRK